MNVHLGNRCICSLGFQGVLNEVLTCPSVVLHVCLYCNWILAHFYVFLYQLKAASMVNPKEIPPEGILLAVYLELQNGKIPFDNGD